jgi:uncharacterized membrane protein YfcA
VFVALLAASALVAAWLAWDFVRVRRDVGRYLYPAVALLLVVAERLATRLSAPSWVSVVLFLAFLAVVIWYLFRTRQEERRGP